MAVLPAKKRNLIRSMAKQRASLEDISNVSKVPIQRVEELLYPLDVIARKQQTQVTQWGPRPEFCQLCGEAYDKLHHHHWDDEDPSKGIWVCSRCHPVVEYYDKIASGDYDDIIGRYIVLKEKIEEKSKLTVTFPAHISQS